MTCELLRQAGPGAPTGPRGSLPRERRPRHPTTPWMSLLRHLPLSLDRRCTAAYAADDSTRVNANSSIQYVRGDDAPRPAYGDAGAARARTPRWPAIASNAHRSDITAAMIRPAVAMTGIGSIAPEKSTAGKHSIGSASAAWAVE